ncbi:thioredoxin domain-containing protein [Desulforhopalus singaporensis]|uniref:Glutaredoxin n=1 Tax=Desulforhopalus singaporensis TaxID=91360 RepID=A0A1H0MPL4_9BACT|nr:hypothetical protein [Desulforhopalus singaporensis]SDO82341.1 Glutaredoxin [Desulforhopalus singaporensis]
MHITFYKSSLCPRCYLVKQHLLGFLSDNAGAKLEEIDILKHPARTWSDGVRMIPAIKIGANVLSSVWLGKKDVIDFLTSQRANLP